MMADAEGITSHGAAGQRARRARWAATAPARAVTVGLVDDDRLVADGLGAWVDRSPGLRVARTAARWSQVAGWFDDGLPDVVLLDRDLGDGVDVGGRVRRLRSAGAAVVVLTDRALAAHARADVEAGALGYVARAAGAARVVEALRSAACGCVLVDLGTGDDDPDGHEPVDAPRRPRLSPQERRALVLYTSDLPMKSVASRMGVSIDTAKCYVDRVRDKYAAVGVQARSKLALRELALADGWRGLETEVRRGPVAAGVAG